MLSNVMSVPSPMILAIDFDGVIHDDKHPIPGKKMGPPIEGAKEALLSFRDLRHRIVIYTRRAIRPGSTTHVRSWCVYYGIPFDDVTGQKPDADVYIDDKAIRFDNWTEVRKALRKYPDWTTWEDAKWQHNEA